ncbi:MAG: glycosyl transferase group 2 family protein, partial [Actinomycetota bacterium]
TWRSGRTPWSRTTRARRTRAAIWSLVEWLTRWPWGPGAYGAIDRLVLLAVRLLLHGALRATYDRPPAAYWLAPLADGLAVLRLAVSAVRPNRRWRGRTYARSS